MIHSRVRIENVTQSPIRPLASVHRSGWDELNLGEAESSVARTFRLDDWLRLTSECRARLETVLILEDLIEQIHRSRWNRIARSQACAGNLEGLVTAGQSKLVNEEFKIGTVALHTRCRNLHRQEMLGTCRTHPQVLALKDHTLSLVYSRRNKAPHRVIEPVREQVFILSNSRNCLTHCFSWDNETASRSRVARVSSKLNAIAAPPTR